jgi:L,D-peptidoglycan transpeptidase YkuD (ErfK/YbiS/YcfS/YnhG family)
LEKTVKGVDPNRPPVQAEGGIRAISGGIGVNGGNVLRRIVIAPVSADRRRGLLVAGGLSVPCALGRNGILRRKREGDGATPAGRLALVAVLYRPDRIRRPPTRLPAIPLRPDSGWCDDPSDRLYNREVRLPFRAGHERLWRSDRLYDVVVVLDYNLARPRRGAGSAIFLHIAAPGFPPTEGCIAVPMSAMRRILARAYPGSFIDVR